ncbi:MAG: sulfotransferase family 2 domain-containing protein [Pseudomonadota bacterium]
MLIFHEHRLVVFSVPRTGSTSLHKALRPHADIEFSNPPTKKHMNVRRFETWAEERRPRVLDYTRVAVMRDPLARLVSWYAYRQRDEVAGEAASTRGMTFEEFITLTLSDTPPPPATVGNQHFFLTRKGGSLGVHEILCIERTDVMLDYFRGVFGDIELPHRNSSPPAEVDLSVPMEARLRAVREKEFALFARVAETGRLSLPA